MKYSELKELYQTFDRDTIELILNNLDQDDFEDGYYRFIKEDEAEKIAINLYEGDTYILGCFNASFISDHTNLDYEIVRALQEGENFEAIGQHILDNDNLDGMIEDYIRLDGYGHVFGSYDGNYDEIEIDNTSYIYFRI